MRTINIADPSKLWFTSDTHWFHSNIIEYCSRGFFDVTEMDRQLITNWNSRVSPIDHVFHLGDFAFSSNIERITKLVNELHGHIHLIKGNHDDQNKFDREAIISLFDTVDDNVYLHVEDEEIEHGQDIFLSHYPMFVWPKNQKGSWQLFGHIHSGPKSTGSDSYITKLLKPSQYDVGVDNNNMAPISYQELKTIITKQYLSKV